MRCVCEDGLENVSRLRRAAVRSDRVTHRTGSDLAFRCVAAKAVIVGLKTGRNMSARAGEVVTRHASLRRSRVATVVDRVVELHVEALDERRRESLDLMRIARHVLVADSTHRLRFAARELAQMATDARFMAGIIHLKRLTLPVMTRRAVELLMLGNCMREVLKCFVVGTRRHRLGSLRRSYGRRRAFLLLQAACRKQRDRTHDEQETRDCLRGQRHSLFLQSEVTRRDRIAPDSR